MSDPFNLETDGVDVTLTFKAAGGYEAPWIVVKGEITKVAQKIGFTEDREAKVSDLAKLSAPVARYYSQQWEASRPGKV